MRSLSLKFANRFRALAAKRGVSKVARSGRGFMTAYTRARGKINNLSKYWQNRRENFVKRHCAQVRKRGEKLFKNGAPTRRHLALIMWAYSPAPEQLRRYLKNQGKSRNGH